MSEESIEIRAVKFAEAYYEQLGWNVKNVSRIGGDHSGYDLFLQRGEEKLMVEVKGCSRPYQIPDLYGSEIDPRTMTLIADEICIVYFLEGVNEPKLARVPRSAIEPQYLIPKISYRISGRFKNQRMMERFLVKG